MNDTNQTAPKPDVTFDQFLKLDLRVARVERAPMAEGTRAPCRQVFLDLGPLGSRVSIGQFALIEEEELVGRNVVVCCNLGTRKIGKYESQGLVMGTLHPQTPAGQSQALPLFAHADASPGDQVF